MVVVRCRGVSCLLSWEGGFFSQAYNAGIRKIAGATHILPRNGPVYKNQFIPGPIVVI